MKIRERGSDRWPWSLLRRDQTALYVLAVLVLAVAARRCFLVPRHSGGGVRWLEPGDRIDYRVDLNGADATELDLLPGIGPAKAARIIAYREAHGPFRQLADLARVPGISRTCVAKLRGLVTPGGTATAGDMPR